MTTRRVSGVRAHLGGSCVSGGFSRVSLVTGMVASRASQAAGLGNGQDHALQATHLPPAGRQTLLGGGQGRLARADRGRGGDGRRPHPRRVPPAPRRARRGSSCPCSAPRPPKRTAQARPVLTRPHREPRAGRCPAPHPRGLPNGVLSAPPAPPPAAEEEEGWSPAGRVSRRPQPPPSPRPAARCPPPGSRRERRLRSRGSAGVRRDGFWLENAPSACPVGRHAAPAVSSCDPRLPGGAIRDKGPRELPAVARPPATPPSPAPTLHVFRWPQRRGARAVPAAQQLAPAKAADEGSRQKSR